MSAYFEFAPNLSIRFTNISKDITTQVSTYAVLLGKTYSTVNDSPIFVEPKDLLLTTDMSVKQISRELGYSGEYLFIKFFTYHEKISPAAFKAKYCNTHINNKYPNLYPYEL